MNKGNKIIFYSATVILAALLSILFLAKTNGRIITAAFLAIAAAVVYFTIKKRIALSINKREVLLLSAVVAVLFVILLLFSGFLFGFNKNPYFMKPNTLLTVALPSAVIIIASEVIRYVFVSQKNGVASVAAFICCILAELLTISTIPEVTTFNKFMDVVGLTLFPSVVANIYYNYSAKRFGLYPNMVFRLIIALYIYFIPSSSGMSEALLSCLKMILPIVMLMLVSAMYEKKKRRTRQKSGKLSTIGTVFSVVVIILVAMLISCQFRFGAIVIATESMTGEINKGDMIIYERYDDQKIEEGQVIVFLENNRRVIHRVVGIETIDGEVRYYTKGDANEDNDAGYRVRSDIVGLTDVKVAYVGYPTLWLRELLSKK